MSWAASFGIRVTLAVTNHLVGCSLSDADTHDVLAQFCATLPKSSRALLQGFERVFDRMIAFYGRTLKFVLGYQTITLLVAVATLVLTVVLYIIIPKGSFPHKTRVKFRHFAGAGNYFLCGYGEQAATTGSHRFLRTRRSRSISSFIGADGTNTTLNSGRISINLKPLNVRKINASDVIRRLQTSLQPVEGITLYMEPVQNITVDDRVSRTQYQYTLEDFQLRRLNLWTARLVEKMKKLPQLADVATDQANRRPAAIAGDHRVTPHGLASRRPHRQHAL